MKAFVLTLIFCAGGIYFLTKRSIKPSITEVSNNIGKQSCTAPSKEGINSSNHKSCCTILDRTSVILRQTKATKFNTK